MPTTIHARGDKRAPILSARAFSKTFSGRAVLRSVDLDVARGEIHGLVGQNGSGTSTFIKILAGYHAPDPGASLAIRGEQVSLPLRPGEPATRGIAFVHQDLGLFEAGSVLENLRVGRHETGFGWRISWRRERAAARSALSDFGLDIDPRTPISALSDVQRAMVAIIRALDQVGSVGDGLLVLDEPTSYLPRDSAEVLFSAMRRAAEMGFGVIFVSHRLAEVLAVTHRVTVLRDGAAVETTATSSLSERALITRMLGFTLDDLYPESHRSEREIVLSAQDVSGPNVHGFSIDVHQGEIVGLTGLLGMGHEQVPYLLFGAEQADSGSIVVDGDSHDLRSLSPLKAMDLGLALLPANRHRDGGVATATAAENLTLPTLPSYFSNGLLRQRREHAQVRQFMRDFDVRPLESRRQFATFSGGNQQKILIAKWFATGPRVFLLHEPAQGVDVGAKKQIFQHIRDAADAGMSVLFATVEYEDLAHLCDRVYVFRHGRVVSELHGAGLTHERIAEQCLRTERDSPLATGAA
jgi:ribose transport system ATP-binding protein